MVTELALAKALQEESRWKPLIFLSILLIGIRLVFTGIMGIMPQDAYYDFYAQHLDLSYYDHPPMIAYVLRLFTSLFGKKVFVLKLADTTVTLLTLVSFYQLAKKFLSGHKAIQATVLLLSTVIVSILSLISTPDVPLMLCWTISLNFLHEALFRKKNMYWIWAGIFTGLSFDSKYTAVFLILGLTGFLLISKSYRKFLFSRWFIVYLICFAITILPVVWWNVQNGFASFKFQSQGRVQEGVHVDVRGFAGVVGHQSAILLPILFFSLLYFIYRLCKKYAIRVTRIPADQLFLLCFFIPLFAGFFCLSFIYWVKLNWMMPAYISGIIWVSRYWNTKWIRYQLIFSVAIHLLLALEILFYIFPIRSDDTWYGWSELAVQVEKVQKQYPDTFIFSADDYKTSAVLNFYLPQMVYSKNIVGERALQFDFIGTDLHALNGRNAIFVDSNPRFHDLENEDKGLPAGYNAWFDQIVPLNPVLIEKNGKVVRKFSIFLCRNYHAPKTVK
jgi:4-amino-4-deoxy-L-arabinose transferase-like glycosyltransferase